MDFKQLKQQINSCKKCSLADTRTKTVPGEGNYQAEIMFIGEGPGKNEDEQGKPFVGRAGNFLTELITSIGLSREEVYITNIVKCRPPNNRDPLPQEVKTCWPWLAQQILRIKPKIIIPLGRHSLARFLPSAKISADHGRALRKKFKFSDKTSRRIVFFPCYHPAAALYNGSLREVLLKDFKKIPLLLKLIKDQEK